MKFLRNLFRRKKPQALLTYTSDKLGRKLEVGAIVCNTCKNYFFVTRAELEKPKFCPYCGIDFSRSLEIVDGGDVDDLIL